MSWLSGIMSWIASLFGSDNKLGRSVVQIQASTVKACGFLPMAETVGALIAVNSPASAPGIATVALIANKICAAVTKVRPIRLVQAGMSSATPGLPTVDGVVIEGEFVERR